MWKGACRTLYKEGIRRVQYDPSGGLDSVNMFGVPLFLASA